LTLSDVRTAGRLGHKTFSSIFRIFFLEVRVSVRKFSRQDGFWGVMGMGHICVPMLFGCVWGTSRPNFAQPIPPRYPSYSRISAGFGAIYVENLIFVRNQTRISSIWGGCQGMGI